MTSGSDSQTIEFEVQYEGAVPTFGGFEAADFILRRPHHPSLECNLGLAQDAQAVFEARAGALDVAAVQGVLRALAARYYGRLMERGEDIQAIVLLRAVDIDADAVDAILLEAGISLSE
jgi:hypothetical protein